MDSERLDDRYELLEEVGSGGMAIVYRGLDHRLGGREIALKVLHPHLSVREQARVRFQNEADAAAGLEHENILKVYDVAPEGSSKSYIVMEFVRGETLTRMVEENPFSIPEVGVMIAHEVTRAVEHAHEARILHRDIKPENVMIREDGVVKLMDFGIARALDTSRMTMTGALMGSPAHMSPEHIEGKELDFRADVFSLGTLLYYLTTGVLPFNAPSPHALLRKILEGDYPPAERVNPTVGRPLSRIIDKALARERKSRYASATALLSELADHLKKLGINDPTAELKAWHAHRGRYEKDLRKRLTGRILELADRATRQSRSALALSHLNRVICLDENNTRALKMLENLHVARDREAGRRRGLAWIAGALATTIGAMLFYMGVIWFQSPDMAPVADAPDPPTPVAVPSPENPPTVEDARTRDAESARSITRRPRRLMARAPESAVRPTASTSGRTIPDKGSRTEPIATPRYPVRILVSPPLARLTLDGRTFKKLPKDPLRLTPGKHRARIDIPDCETCEIVERAFLVHANKANPSLRLKARLKDAHLRVLASLNGRVLIDGSDVGSTNRDIRIPIPYSSAHRRSGRTIKLEVKVDGHPPHRSELTLRPGTDERVRVKFVRPPSPPRTGQGAMVN